MKKYISAILIICLLLCSCKAADVEEPEESFNQIDIGRIINVGDVIKLKELDEQNYTLITFKEDSLNDFLVYNSADGGQSWELEKLSWIENMDFRQDSCVITSVDKNNEDSYLVSYDILNDAYERVKTVVCLISGGKASELTVFDNPKNLVTSKFVGNKIGVNCEDMLILYDFSGNELVNIKSEKIIDFCEYGKNILVVGEAGLIEYNQDGEKIKDYKKISNLLMDSIREIGYENDTRQLRKDIASSKNGEDVYILLNDGIYRVYMKNDVVENVISDEKNLFATGSVNAFIVTADDKIYLGGNGNSANEVDLVGFFYDDMNDFFVLDEKGELVSTDTEKKNSTIRGNIKIYSLENSDFIDNAIKMFEKKYPDVNIVYEIGVDEENNLTTQDAINAFNTKMLSGDGPDIIFMDGLDIGVYIDNGQLLEITDVIEEYEGETLKSIVDTFKADDKLYAIPTRFSIPMIYAETSEIDKLKSPENLYQYINMSNTGINDLFIYSADTLYETFFSLYAQDVFSNGDVNKDMIYKFVNETSKIYDACKAHNNEIDNMLQKEAALQFDSFDGLNVIPGINNYTGRRIDVWPDVTIGQLQSQIGVMHLYTAYDYMKENNLDYTFDMVSDTYMPQMIVGVNKQSGNVLATKEFVKSLFSEDIAKYENTNYVMQSFGDYEQPGMSVSKPARHACVEQYRDMQYTIAANSDNGMSSKIILHSDVTTEEERVFEGYYSKVKTPVYVDKITEQIIVNHLDSVLAGDESPEDAAEKICYEIETYIQE